MDNTWIDSVIWPKKCGPSNCNMYTKYMHTIQ
jgi:hypothetical protein